MILPNEDFLRAAEALRLHHFTIIEPESDTSQYLEGLEHYAAQYSYPPELIEKHGRSITIALFPASFVGWKLVYIPMADPLERGKFHNALAVQKIPLPVDTDVEHSFIQLSRTSSRSEHDTISLADDDSTSTISGGRESDDEYFVVDPYAQVQPTPRPRAGSVAMERGNGPISPTQSVMDIADMKPERGVGAVEMLPGHKMLEKPDGQLFMVLKGIYVPRVDPLKESFRNAGEFISRDGAGGTKFARVLDGWGKLLGDRKDVV